MGRSYINEEDVEAGFDALVKAQGSKRLVVPKLPELEVPVLSIVGEV